MLPAPGAAAAVAAAASAAGASAGGFMPPAWPAMLWLLRASCALWLLLLAGAALRTAAHVALQSEWLRRASRRARARRSPWQAVAVAGAQCWRQARHGIVRFHMPEPQVARWFGLPRFIFGVGVCVLYVVDTYMQGIPAHFYFLQALYGCAVAVNLVLSFAYASRPLLFMFRLTTVFDCLSIPSLLTSNGGQWLNFNFLQAYCILMEWSILEKYDIVLFNYPALARLLVNLVLQMISFVYITSCGVQFCELLGDPGERIASETFQITWANSVYFAVVTLMTVGYGDFVPYTLLGRLWIVFHIIFAAYLVSREISLLIDALKSMRRGGGSFVTASSSSFVVVTGHVPWQFLLQFTEEFLAEPEHLDVKVVVLTFNTKWTDDDWKSLVVQKPFYDYHLIFLEGSPLKSEDLGRAKVDSASGVFVFADPHRNDPYLEDSDTLKALLTIRNYAPDVPIYTMNAVHDSSFQFKIAMEQIKEHDSGWLRNKVQSSLAASRAYNTFTHLLPATPGPSGDPVFGDSMAENDLAVSSARFDSADARTAGHPQLGRSGLSFPPGDMGSPVRPSASAAPPDASPGFSGSISSARNFQDELFSLRNSPTLQLNSAKQKEERALGESLCMQKLEMALLAENVFCNGLSTLITNFAKRVQQGTQTTDPPWLLEYKYGAECGVRFREMPPAFCGRRVSDIAISLYDYGIVIIAVRRSTAHNWRLLRTDTILEAGMIIAMLTYHDGTVIERIEKHLNEYILEREQQVAAERAVQEAASALSPEMGQPVELHQNIVAGAVHRGELNDSMDMMNDGLEDSPTELVGHAETSDADSRVESSTRVLPTASSVATSQVLPGMSSGLSPRPIGVGVSPLSTALRLSSTGRAQVPPLRDLPTSIASSSSAPRGKNREAETGETPSAQKSSGSDGRRNAGHRGRRSLGGKEHSSSEDDDANGNRTSTGGLRVYTNRERLRVKLTGHIIVCLDGENSLISLDYLLKRINMKRIGDTMSTPVVVIHSCFPKNFEREVSHHADYVYLLKGNFLTRDTMRQAQFETSRCILIMALDSSATGSTDSKAIFTVMTLDALLWDDANTFLCCVLDAEESLQLLQSPRRSRRKGIHLGVHRDPTVLLRERSSRPGSSAFFNYAPRTLSVGSFAHRSVESSPFIPTLSSAASGLDAPNTSLSFGPSTIRNRFPRTESSNLGSRRTSLMKRSASVFFESEGSENGTGRESSAQSSRQHYGSQLNARDLTETKEPQRFASGEMMISSFLSGLLVREYVSPGFVQLIRELIGTGAETTQCWIRHIDVPGSWIESGSMEGRTYRETVERLFEFGCIPIGLYRSGDAPVRMPFDEDASEPDLPTESESAALSDYPGNSAHVARTLSQLAIDAPLMAGSFLSLHDEMHRLRGNSEEFDEMYYECPTTLRRIRYREANNGENSLPYVYTNPEPYTIVAASDAVFVLCPPDLSIPSVWHES